MASCTQSAAHEDDTARAWLDTGGIFDAVSYPYRDIARLEQEKTQPDQSARAYLRAIAGDAAAVQRALKAGPKLS